MKEEKRSRLSLIYHKNKKFIVFPESNWKSLEPTIKTMFGYLGRAIEHLGDSLIYKILNDNDIENLIDEKYKQRKNISIAIEIL